jgi:hypothetical protein
MHLLQDQQGRKEEMEAEWQYSLSFIIQEYGIDTPALQG